MVTKYEVDPEELFARAIRRASTSIDDLKIPLRLISLDFFKSQKPIWSLKGPGQYEDLNDDGPSGTKATKLRKYGFVYPILKATGRLEKSMTDPRGSETINEVTKTALEVGTKVPYGIFHQSSESRTKIPFRPFLFIGPEAPQFALKQHSGRPGRWLNILNDFVLKNISEEIEA